MKKEEIQRMEAIAEASDAHNERSQKISPTRAREALMSGPRRIGRILLHPPSLLHTCCLEAIEHPILGLDPDAKARPLDVVHLIYIFAEPQRAFDLLEEEGKSAFTAAARAFAGTIPAGDVNDLVDAIRELNTKGQPPGDAGTSGSAPEEPGPLA
jgi:hypothetical protein